MANATRTRSAKPAAPKVTTKVDGDVTTYEVNLTAAKVEPMLAKMAEYNEAKKTSERIEKELKKELRELAGAPKLENKNQRILLKVSGIIRGVWNFRSRTNCDLDLLMSAFPEAFDACTSKSEYEQFTPR